MPTLSWGKLSIPAHLSTRDESIVRVVARWGFLSFVEGLANVCRKYAAEENRAQELWRFRLGYFSRYVEMEREFLDGRSRFELKRTE
jgi:hypothetical protein